MPAVFSLLMLVAAPDDVDFAHDVAPVLREHCGKCHTGEQKKGGLSLNTRATLLAGGESGRVVVPGSSSQSEFLTRLTSDDPDVRMPPEGPRVPGDKIALLAKWIDRGLKWEDGFSFGRRSYEPPLAPRRPVLPPSIGSRDNPIDRILDAELAARQVEIPPRVSDAMFLRRTYLDLIGLLPTPDELQRFLQDTSPDKRSQAVHELLDRDVDYAEHWLTFWNDLLRNDYTGTGFITGGRKQITRWLYDALVTNMPYDAMARELIAPTSPDSAGFGEGIRWRGEVAAGQTVEMQFAQSVGQALLGINLKCASCHDSFIDRWKLEESYGLAAIYSSKPLEIHRCDKPIGKTATAAWLFPELGQIDPQAPQPERLKQLASLMTHPENGRFTRTIVNRIWHRLMGRGIVHPTDAMQSQPWNADLLDYLAVHLADHRYDLRATIALIATSQAYQARTQVVTKGIDDGGYIYVGPRARRMTAEQFMDAVWQLTGAAPTRIDAPVLRGKPVGNQTSAVPLSAKWIWNAADTLKSPAGETVVFRRKLELKETPTQSVAVASCDNSFVLFVNGKQVQTGDNWNKPEAILLAPHLKAGTNELVVEAKNAGSEPNPAGFLFEARLQMSAGMEIVASGTSWEWTAQKPNRNGKFAREPGDWRAAAVVTNAGVWAGVHHEMAAILARGERSAGQMVRASLVKSDFLMRTLGRPNRDQIVTVRPTELSTLEAIDLANGQTFAEVLDRGASHLAARDWPSPEAFVSWLFNFALSRKPTDDEQAELRESLGDRLTKQGIADALWLVVMLPEFQLVR